MPIQHSQIGCSKSSTAGAGSRQAPPGHDRDHDESARDQGAGVILARSRHSPLPQTPTTNSIQPS